MKRPLVYIAGPYSKPDPVTSVRRAVRVFDHLLATKMVVPICPHLSMLADLIIPRAYEDWLRYDLDLIEHCQAVLRIEGQSPGADAEVARARELGLPVFHTIADVVVWAPSPASVQGEKRE